MTYFGEIGAAFFWWGIGIIVLTVIWYGSWGKNNKPTRHNWAGIMIGGCLLVIFGCLGLSWIEVQLKPIFWGYKDEATILAAELPVIAIFGGTTTCLWRRANHQWNPPARVFGAVALAGIIHVVSAVLLRNVAYGLYPSIMVGAIAGLFCSRWFRDRFARWREDRAACRAITRDPASDDQSLEAQPEGNEGIQPAGEDNPVEGKVGERALQLHDVAFWHAVVEVTRGPAMLVADPTAYPPGRLPAEGQTWLAEYRRGESYGLRIAIKGGAKLEFFARCDTEGEAMEVASTMLEEMKHRFRGLHGKAFARGISRADLLQENLQPYCELSLPAPPYEKGIAFLEKLVDIGRDISDGVECTILWHRPSWWETNKSEKNITRGRVPKALEQQLGPWARRLCGVKIPRDLYMARIYVTAQQARVGSIDALLGRLSALKIGIVNNKSEGASWGVAPPGTHLNILKCHFHGGQPVAPAWGRFDFPDNLKLPRGFLLVSENFYARRGLRQDDPGYIILGDALVDGAPTRYLGYVAVKDLPTSGVILGTTGTGKSTCLAHVVRQVVQKCPQAGILILNVGKAGEERHFPFARVIRWDGGDFGIPWFVRGAKHETACEQFAYNLAAALGLKRPLPYVVQNTLAWDGKDPAQEDTSPCTELPVDFHAFVRKLRAYLRAHPYAADTQADIVRMIDNRVARLDTPGFGALTRLDRPERFGWFRDWLEGRHVFLDLTGAPQFLMKFITFTIFQMIREVAPQAQGILRNLLVIDEAHVIFPRPTNPDPDDEEMIAASFMGKLLGEYLDEFRSRGHALLLSNQEPANLLPAAYEKPGLKIAFHLPARSAQLLLPESPDRVILQRLPQHQALVIDGATGQFYCIQTRPPPKGAEPDPARVEETRAQCLQENIARIEGKGEVQTTQDARSPEDPDLMLDDLKKPLAARPKQVPPQVKPVLETTREGPLGNEKNPGEPHSSPQPAQPPATLAIIHPKSSYLDLIYKLESHERTILRDPNFVHPLLATAPGQGYLEGKAREHWNDGQPHEAYCLEFARYHNRARAIIQVCSKGLVTTDFFTTVKGGLRALLPRGHPMGRTLDKALEGLHTKHELILGSPRVDLVTFQQAIGALKWVTRELVAAIKNGDAKRRDGQLMLPPVSTG